MRNLWIAALWLMTLLGPTIAWQPVAAQPPQGSGSRGPSPVPQRDASEDAAAVSPPSSTAPAEKMALAGWCSVVLRDQQRWIKGDPAYSASYDGLAYYFSGREQKLRFEANPARYAVALQGDCPTTLVDRGERVRGDLRFGLDRGGKLYFFASETHRHKFLEHLDKYEAALAKGTAEPDAAAAVALAGYCPVSLHIDREWVKGGVQHGVTFDGQRYLMAGEDQRRVFLASPGRFVPVLGGDCVVCLEEGDARVAGSVYHTIFHRDRLYLFASEEQKTRFRQQPEGFEDTDLALGGNCVVCEAELDRSVPGEPEYAALYRGMRYFFPSEEQLEKFISEPQRYAVPPSGPR